MSFQAMTAAIKIRGVSPSEKLLLLALANYADETGNCWPSQTRLADDTCMSSRTVRTLLASLETVGYIAREQRRRPDGYRATDQITLRFAQAEEFSPENISPEKKRKSQRKSATISPERISPPTTFEPIIEPIIEPALRGELLKASQETEFSAAFETFWKGYPSKKSKRDAWKAWGPALKRAGTLAALIDGVETAKRSSRQWREGFVPHPATWLRADGWLDEYGPSKVVSINADLRPARMFTA